MKISQIFVEGYVNAPRKNILVDHNSDRYVREISLYQGILSELLGKIDVNMVIFMCLGS